MIHQHIFASPKPGLSEAEFQRYWLEVHAIKFASKIKQIKKYKICTRLDWAGEQQPPLWNAFAEIWLNNEQEQLESLQSPEFLQGARLDEPSWAAFWNTQVLDCDTVTLLDTIGEAPPAASVKLVALRKRKPGLSVEDYRTEHLEVQAPLAQDLPGLLRHDVCFTRDSWYAVGEPRFDSVTHFWFEDLAALDRLAAAPSHPALGANGRCFDPKYNFQMATKEHWIIGPAARA
jgi:EthD domain-containing protein